MVGDDFLYGTTWLSDFGMSMMASEEDPQFVSRNVERSEITSIRSRPNHYGATYADVLILHFRIMPTDGLCGNDQNLLIMSDNLINDIRAWLESPKLPQILNISRAEPQDVTVYYFGIFTDVQPYMIGSNCCGLDLTFTCDSPYGYSDIHTVTYKINTAPRVHTGQFFNASAELNEYQMPTITIYSVDEFEDDETITITNTTDNNNAMVLTLPSGLSQLTIDCEKKKIMDQDGNLISLSELGVTSPEDSTYSFIATEQYFFYWLSLLPGENKLTFEPSDPTTISKITISSRDVLKTGGF